MKWLMKPLLGIGFISTATFLFSCGGSGGSEEYGEHGFCDTVPGIPGSSGFICEGKFSTCQQPKFVCKVFSIIPSSCP